MCCVHFVNIVSKCEVYRLTSLQQVRFAGSFEIILVDSLWKEWLMMVYKLCTLVNAYRLLHYFAMGYVPKFGEVTHKRKHYYYSTFQKQATSHYIILYSCSMLISSAFNPCTAMVPVPSLRKQPVKMPNLKSWRPSHEHVKGPLSKCTVLKADLL